MHDNAPTFAIVYTDPAGGYAMVSRTFTDERTAERMCARYNQEATPTKYWTPDFFLATIED